MEFYPARLARSTTDACTGRGCIEGGGGGAISDGDEEAGGVGADAACVAATDGVEDW